MEVEVTHTIVVHVLNSDPVVGETEELPSVNDTMVMLKNPRRMDGKDLHYLSPEVVTVYWPIERVNFIEVITGEEEEPIIGFIRE
jgi:hypothetical protein